MIHASRTRTKIMQARLTEGRLLLQLPRTASILASSNQAIVSPTLLRSLCHAFSAACGPLPTACVDVARGNARACNMFGTRGSARVLPPMHMHQHTHATSRPPGMLLLHWRSRSRTAHQWPQQVQFTLQKRVRPRPSTWVCSCHQENARHPTRQHRTAD